jgi:cell division septal protein FtsQ
MPRRSSKRKSKKKKKPSTAKRGHAYEIAKPNVELSARPLVGFWQVRGGTLLSLLLLAALALLTSQFFTTDRFYVYDAEVQGNRFVDRSEIYAASGLHELSIFWINTGQVEAAISSLLGIREVKVTCRLPNRVKIEVVERQPRIVWQRGEKRYWVDEQGIVLSMEGELEGMFLIHDLTPGPLEVGDCIDSEVIASALELRRLLPEAAAFSYSEDRGFSFDQRGYPIHFGTGDIAEKVAILNALLRDLALEGITPKFVDVRFKESPFYSY